MRIFVDSDVIISSLLSSSGAAHLLITEESLTLFISSISRIELEVVVDRLSIEKEKLNTLIVSNVHITLLSQSLTDIKELFKEYVWDKDDAHIVAGAKSSEANFLITYNLRDFKVGKIKKDFNIITVTPGQFLQYIRSLK